MQARKIVLSIYKIIKTLTLIGLIICLVGAGVSLLLGSLVLSVPGFFQSQLMGSLVEVAGNISVIQLGMILLAAMVQCIGAGIPLYYAHRYCTHVLTERTPFTMDGSRELMLLGIRVVAFPLVANIISTIMTSAAGINQNNSPVEIGGGILLILMSFLLRYGAELEEGNNYRA